MAAIRYPIVIWKDAQGRHTVTTLSGTYASAVDEDRRGCIEQIKRFLDWKHNKTDEGWDPYFSEPQIGEMEVPIRTEYRLGSERVFPSEQTMNVPVTYVWGTRTDGSVLCVLPLLEKNFTCRNEKLLKPFVMTRAQQAMQGITPARLAQLLNPGEISVDSIHVPIKWKSRPREKRKFTTLESVAVSLGSRESRKQFSRAWQRDRLIEHLANRLRQPQGNILLLGPHGVGKTNVLVNAIRHLDKNLTTTTDSPNDSENQFKPSEQFWYTSAHRLIAGMQYLGQWEERVEWVIDELAILRGFLCIDNLQQLVRLGGREPVESIAAFLAPFMENNELRVVIESTREELESCRRLLPGFDSLFQLVQVPAIELDDARKVLAAIGDQHQQNRKIEYEVEAAELCLQLFRRFMPYTVFPGKCVLFWSELFDDLHKQGRPELDRELVVEKFVRQTGLPEPLVRDDYSLESSEVRSWFESRIVDQQEACRRVTGIITTFKAGLNDPNRPIGVQLFCGPTGVGKTEMAKALADYMFGSGEAKDRLVRLDMSEYAGPQSGERLLMKNDGSPSDFIQKIREQPFVIVLLDEIEKASPEIFDVLMSVFDEGRLTDRWGRTTDFRSSVIVMTSNLGVRRTAAVGFEANNDGAFESEVKKFFRPEFFNRFDAVVAFKPLSQESIQKIAVLELNKVAKRDGFVSRGLQIKWDDGVVSLLAERGFHPRFGARPLQRTIEELVVIQLARLISESPRIKDKVIRLVVEDNEVIATM